MQTTEIRETWTALYARLSLDDGNVGESMSIQSQKAILTRKAEELGIYNYRFYVDDGYSGTNFNRPVFQALGVVEVGFQIFVLQMFHHLYGQCIQKERATK